MKRDIDKRIRVCMVMPKLQVGGAEVQVLNLLGNLDRTRFALSLCLFNEGDAGMQRAAAESVESVFVLGFRWRRFPAAFFTLVRHLRKGRFDVVHTHLAPADLVGRAAARMAGVPVLVTTEHGKGLWKSKGRLLIERALNRITDARVCVSRDIMELRRERERTPENKLVYIPNAVDPEQFVRPAKKKDEVMAEFGWAAGDPLVLSVGRLVAAKDYTTMVEAFSILLSRIPVARCVIAGEGECRGEIEEAVSRFGLQGSLALPGSRSDVPDLLAAADLFVMSSIREGLPVSMLEAMASGTPVVSTAVGGIPDAVTDGDSALLVPPRDPAALASAMERVLSDGSLRGRLAGNAARVVEERFGIKSAAETLGAIYESLLGRKGRR